VLLLYVYRLFYTPVLILFYIFRFLNPKLHKGFHLRNNQEGTPPWLNYPEKSKPIWFHCASGEFEYAKPVIRQLKAENPNCKILVTYFSPSVESSLKNNQDVDFFCPTPWDTLRSWQEFLDYHQPQALLIARTDLWPMMLFAAKKARVPSLLFSRSVNPNRGTLQIAASRFLLRLVDTIFCVSEEDRRLLIGSGLAENKIHSAGDTRYDQCFHRLQNPQVLKPLKNFYLPTLVAGSTWSADEAILLPAIAKLMTSMSFIIAPHEPSESHLQKLESSLKKMGLSFCRYSSVHQWNPEQVLIIDQVGILADLYSWSSFAFVGGSMDRSVHSVMEPLAQGLLTFVGPKHSNSREALLFQRESIAGQAPVQVIKNSMHLEEALSKALLSWTSDHKDQLQITLQRKRGASKIVQRWLENQFLSPKN